MSEVGDESVAGGVFLEAAGLAFRRRSLVSFRIYILEGCSYFGNIIIPPPRAMVVDSSQNDPEAGV